VSEDVGEEGEEVVGEGAEEGAHSSFPNLSRDAQLELSRTAVQVYPVGLLRNVVQLSCVDSSPRRVRYHFFIFLMAL
jgi:hypothetical protein